MNNRDIIIAASIALALVTMLKTFPKRQNIARAIAVWFLAYADAVDIRQQKTIQWKKDIWFMSGAEVPSTTNNN